MSYSTNLHFVTYVTVEPNREEINNYLLQFYDEIIKKFDNELSIFGPQVAHIKEENTLEGINVYHKIEAFIEEQLDVKIFV